MLTKKIDEWIMTIFLIKWRCLIKEVIKFGCHYFKDQFWAAHAYDETMNILYY